MKMKTQMKPPKKIAFTKTGYEELQKKYALLLEERVIAVEQLKKARDMGDLSENGFYKASKAKLGSLDHQIHVSKHLLRYGTVTTSLSQETAEVGNTILIATGQEKREIFLVGEHEANPSLGKISFRSPLGKGLLHKRVNDIIEIEIPKGIVKYTILGIS